MLKYNFIIKLTRFLCLGEVIMAKYRPYHSPIKRLWQKLGVVGAFISDTYYKYNKFDDYHDSGGEDPRHNNMAPEFLGAFHPWLSMAKDVVDTIKPYKSGFHVWRDLIQPIRGIGNIIKGAAYLPTTIGLFVFEFFRGIVYGIAKQDLNIFKSLMQLAFVRVSSGLLDGVNNLIRGVLQIATTPLTWIFRMPLRGIITSQKGWPTFEETQYKNALKLEELVKKEDKNLDDTVEIDFQMARLLKKIEKAEKRGQEFINKEELDIKFNEIEESFTDMRMTSAGYINGVMGGSYYRSPVPRDGQEKRQNALALLSLFTQKGSSPRDVSVASDEMPLFNN